MGKKRNEERETRERVSWEGGERRDRRKQIIMIIGSWERIDVEVFELPIFIQVWLVDVADVVLEVVSEDAASTEYFFPYLNYCVYYFLEFVFLFYNLPILYDDHIGLTS